MPIDSGIYAQQQPFRLNTPFEALGQIGQLQQQQQVIASAKALEQERQAKLAEDAKKQAEADRFNAVIGNPNLTPENFLEQVRINAPEHYLSTQKSFQEAQKAAEDLKKIKADADQANANVQVKSQEYTANLARQVAAHGNTPEAFELAMKLHEQAFPGSQTPTQLRDYVKQKGPDAIAQLTSALTRSAPQTSEAEDKTQTTAVELPKKQADAVVAQQVAAGTVGGLTPEQQRQAADRQAQLKVSQGQLGVAQGRLKVEQANAAEKNQPVDITSSVNTTASGRQYVDLSTFQTPKAREDARKAADTAGVMAVGKDVADGLRAADTARGNFNTMIGQLRGKLPTDPTGRIITGPKNTLEKYFQTDADLAAFGSWRQAAIQGVQALAEKGMGLRLNQTEINNMIDSLPKLTDTWDTAQKKIGNFTSMLDNKEKNALTRDRSSLTPPPALSAEDLIKKYGGR